MPNSNEYYNCTILESTRQSKPWLATCFQFLEDAKLSHKLDEIQIKTPENTNHPLFQKNIVLTGFRDKELMKKISDVGGILTSSVSKNTFAVLVKHDDTTGKTQQANGLNVPVIKAHAFASQYMLS